MKLIAIDGKTIRRSFKHAWDKSGMAHLVSAFVDAPTISSSRRWRQKIKAMRLMPSRAAARAAGFIRFTIDAIGCQKEIARQIVEAEGQYVLAVKENQKTLHEKVKTLLDDAILENFEGMAHDIFNSVDGDHGRIETRKVWVTDELQWLGEIAHGWPGSTAVAAVECRREDTSTGKTSTQRRHFIGSCKTLDAKAIAAAMRGHWAIENKLHWQLDVSFNEDQHRIRKDHGAENFSRLCRIALNLLKRDKSVKIGIHGKKIKAASDEPYLLRLLTS